MTLGDQLIPWVSAVLQTTPQRWLQLTQTLPAQLLHIPPAPGEWSALLPRQSHHAELGVVTLDEMLHEWAAHDLMYSVQAERALLQPFIAGCGPWQPYFVDHMAGNG